MPLPTYTVVIDNGDDDFADAGEDITARVLRAEWRLGLDAPFDSLCGPSSAVLTLHNPDGVYSPEVTAGLSPGLSVRIQANDGTLRTLFRGFIERVEPDPGLRGRAARLHLRGLEGDLMANRVRLGLQVNATADAVIDAVLRGCRLRYRALIPYMVIGMAGLNVIGTHKLFGDPAVKATWESGKSVFAYIGDTWAEGLPAWEVIRQIAGAERGRFLFDREGRAVFYNRHHTLLTTSSAATFADDMDGLDYAYGAEIVNQVKVTVRQRSIGTPNSVLWRLERPQAVHPGESRVLVAPYRDADGKPVGALTVTPPQRYTDWQANTRADGTGVDMTAKAVVLLTGGDASAATLELRNPTTKPFYLLAGAQIRGTLLEQPDTVTVEARDSASITLYGLRTLDYDLPALSSVDEAHRLAGYEVGRRAAPRGTARSIKLSGTLHRSQILARTLFDRITVEESATGHAADYFIAAEEHVVELGSARHTCTWLLEPADTDAYFIIGTHNPDGSHRLAF